MKGLSIDDNCDIEIIDNDFKIVENSELLRQELLIFLQIKSGHFVEGELKIKGEVFNDMNFGIDFEIYREGTQEELKTEIQDKILNYFSDRITEISEIKIKDLQNRERKTEIKYKSIYGGGAIQL